MGYETVARTRFVPRSGAPQEAEAKGLVETDELILRGGVRAEVARFSDTHTAEKLVVPKAKRGGKA